MKKFLIMSIIACGTIPLAWAQTFNPAEWVGAVGPGARPTAETFSYSDLAKMVEYSFEKGRENIVDLAEKLFPGANKTFTFFAKFKDGAVIDGNITLDGNNLKIAENIPAGKYDVPLSVCREDANPGTLNTTRFNTSIPYSYYNTLDDVLDL